MSNFRNYPDKLVSEYANCSPAPSSSDRQSADSSHDHGVIATHYRRHQLGYYLDWVGTVHRHPLRLVKTFARNGFTTLLTDGVSDFHTASAHELVLYARDELRPWHYELLRWLAEHISRGDLTDWGDILDLPSELTRDGNGIVAVSFMPPFFESPEFETLRLNDEPVKFLMVVPLSMDQTIFASRYSCAELENALGKSGYDFATG